jgi:hypothetical protein
MNPIVIINGYLIDLEPGQTIARTLQVSDIGNLEHRQVNYTNRFKAGDTARNRIAFQFLSKPGNNSNVPYQRNGAYLFARSGECFVNNGWAMVTRSGGGYEIYIYDGIIDLYKQIENQSLTDIGLTELNHTKSLAAVTGSWAEESPYRYILADYGGKVLYDTNKINIDYLVPSVNTSWLWGKLFEAAGWTYAGAVFATEEFINHWMSFPKGIFSTEPDDERFNSSAAELNQDTINIAPGITITPDSKCRYVSFSSVTTEDPTIVLLDKHIILSEPGQYRVEISGEIGLASTFGISVNAQFNMARNAQGFSRSQSIPVYETMDIVGTTGGIGTAPAPVSMNFLIDVTEMESICFFVRAGSNILSALFNSSSVTVSKVTQQDVYFDDALSEFSQKDFVKEVLIKWGLTPFTDTAAKHIKFLTLQERLQTAGVEDWSQKFVKVDGESYTHGGYAQNNILAFNYNDKESTYNDGSITVDNVNLPDSKTILKSKIYSPERNPVQMLGRPTNVYPLWQKQVESDGEVSYKPLDKRFYFLRSQTIEIPSTVIGSEALTTETSVTSVPVESFFKMKMPDVIADNYAPLVSILDKSLMQNVVVDLKDADIARLSFEKLYYIDKTASYYLLNKLPNYISGKLSRAEMIRVFFSPPPEVYVGLTITSVTWVLKPGGYLVRYVFTNTTGIEEVTAHLNGVASVVTPTLEAGTTVWVFLPDTPYGAYSLYLTAEGYTSNTVNFVLPQTEIEAP